MPKLNNELSMIEPPIENLISIVGDPYTLVIIVADRACQINEGSKILTAANSSKPVPLATSEVAEGKIAFIRTKSGIK